jgi:hypothetical protein
MRDCDIALENINTVCEPINKNLRNFIDPIIYKHTSYYGLSRIPSQVETMEELIVKVVKECAYIAKRANDDKSADLLIKEHFGV